MIPTTRANDVHQPIKRLLSEVRDVLRPPEAFDAANSQEHFRLVSSDYAQVVVLGRIMEQLKSKAPGITLSVLALNGDPMSLLASGNADMIMAPSERCPPWCESETLLADEWACVRRRGETLPRTRSSYLKLAHIEVGTERGFGNPIDATLRSGGLERIVRLHVSDFAGALFVAASSDLVVTVPRPVAEHGSRLLPLSLGKLPFQAPRPAIAMIWPRRLSTDPAHGWLRAAVKNAVT